MENVMSIVAAVGSAGILWGIGFMREGLGAAGFRVVLGNDCEHEKLGMSAVQVGETGANHFALGENYLMPVVQRNFMEIEFTQKAVVNG